MRRQPRDPVVCCWKNAGDAVLLFVKLRQNIWFTATANSRFTWTVRLPLRQPIFSAIIRKSATIPMQLLRSFAQGINPILFPGLKPRLHPMSRKPSTSTKPLKVIISASGMCDAGRRSSIIWKHNLWRQESTVLFVGYQAVVAHSGRALIGGAKEVKLFQEEVHGTRTSSSSRA